MGVIIEDVKVVGLCSKHRANKKEDLLDILKYKNGEIIPDSEIACASCGMKNITGDS